MAESVTPSAGKLTRFFNFGTVSTPLNYFTGATTGVSQPMYAEGIWKTFQASSMLIAGGAVTATVNIQGTNDPKTAEGSPFAVFTSNSTTVTSGALFGGYYNPMINAWIPPVMIGDTVVVAGQTVTVSAIASASSITVSAAITSTGSFNALIFGQLWSMTTAVTLTPAGTGFGVADATLVSAHRWVRANLSALSSTVTIVQVMMVY